jgi:mono/diheme cytochrome c family protein
MHSWIFSLSTTACLAGALVAQQKPAAQPPATVAPSATTSSNKIPVTPTPESQAKAKTLFGYDCVSCHGDKGDGKGDLAKDMGITVPDLTNPATLKDIPDETLFHTIHDGKGPMPEEGDRAKTDEIWNLVVYVRSLSQKPGTAAPAKANPATAPAAH